MLNNGAAGETLAQINKVLGFEKSGADSINAFCYKMLSMSSNTDPLTKVMIANNIYVNKDYELNPNFVQKVRTFYNAEPETRDFEDGQTMDVINQWASDHTEQMIQKVLDEESYDSDAVSYLLNAIYFKGTWTYKFDKAMTRNEEFIRLGRNEELLYLPMMHQLAELEYAESDDFQALRLPYGSMKYDDLSPNNSSFVMTVLLPKAQTSDLPKVPTAQEWQQLNQKMHITQTDVKLPRFESDTDIDLKPIMMKLGMPDAFDMLKADFPYFCNTEVYISLMKQVAKIKLDEEGPEAAAVTVIAVNEKASVSGPDYVTFHANHPFLYVISEQQTGAVFFIGRYTGY